MSVTQDADLIINLLGFGALLWLSALTVIRWIRKGRVESYTVDALLPKWLPSWARWLLAPTFVITPTPSVTDSGSERPPRWGITPLGWLLLGCVTLWLLAKTV